MPTIDLGFFNSKNQQADNKLHYYPLVIQASYQVQNESYSTLLYFDLNISGGSLRLIRRKIMTPSGLLVLEEAYGLNTNRTDGESSRECVICLTNEKNTIAKPCKHVSCCRDCAEVIIQTNRQCPICRQEIRDFSAF